MPSFYSIKLNLINLTGLERDALHIYVALLVFVAACMARGWNAAQWKPWLVVLLAALTGEALDLGGEIAQERPADLAASWHDLWNTMLLPSVLVLIARSTDVFGLKRTTSTADQSEP